MEDAESSLRDIRTVLVGALGEVLAHVGLGHGAAAARVRDGSPKGRDRFFAGAIARLFARRQPDPRFLRGARPYVLACAYAWPRPPAILFRPASCED
jgi:hypothetical protein